MGKKSIMGCFTLGGQTNSQYKSFFDDFSYNEKFFYSKFEQRNHRDQHLKYANKNLRLLKLYISRQ